MRSLATWGGAILAVLVLASAATAADAIAAGRVKNVDAGKKEFVLTDAAGKDFTFKVNDQTIMNRGGKESQSDLSKDDSIFVQYDKGVVTWAAKYILIREGDSKNWELAQGKLKSYEPDKKYFTYTNEEGKDATFPAGEAKAWRDSKEAKFEELKLGEPVLLIVAKEGGKTNLKWVMCARK